MKLLMHLIFVMDKQFYPKFLMGIVLPIHTGIKAKTILVKGAHGCSRKGIILLLYI